MCVFVLCVRLCLLFLSVSLSLSICLFVCACDVFCCVFVIYIYMCVSCLMLGVIPNMGCCFKRTRLFYQCVEVGRRVGQKVG